MTKLVHFIGWVLFAGLMFYLWRAQITLTAPDGTVTDGLGRVATRSPSLVKHNLNREGWAGLSAIGVDLLVYVAGAAGVGFCWLWQPKERRA